MLHSLCRCVLFIVPRSQRERPFSRSDSALKKKKKTQVDLSSALGPVCEQWQNNISRDSDGSVNSSTRIGLQSSRYHCGAMALAWDIICKTIVLPGYRRLWAKGVVGYASAWSFLTDSDNTKESFQVFNGTVALCARPSHIGSLEATDLLTVVQDAKDGGLVSSRTSTWKSWKWSGGTDAENIEWRICHAENVSQPGDSTRYVQTGYKTK